MKLPRKTYMVMFGKDELRRCYLEFDEGEFTHESRFAAKLDGDTKAIFFNVKKIVTPRTNVA